MNMIQNLYKFVNNNKAHLLFMGRKVGLAGRISIYLNK